MTVLSTIGVIVLALLILAMLVVIIFLICGVDTDNIWILIGIASIGLYLLTVILWCSGVKFPAF